MNFKDLPSAKKGTAGEFIVDAILNQKGVIPYHPIFDGPHPFDRLCASLDKRSFFIVEVKTKPRRKFYPDTGINVSHYNDYKFVQENHNIRVFLAFVDEIEKLIYGNYLTALDMPVSVKAHGVMLEYPRIEKTIIYFPLSLMKNIAQLDDAKTEKLKALSNRSYIYE